MFFLLFQSKISTEINQYTDCCYKQKWSCYYICFLLKSWTEKSFSILFLSLDKDKFTVLAKGERQRTQWSSDSYLVSSLGISPYSRYILQTTAQLFIPHSFIHRRTTYLEHHSRCWRKEPVMSKMQVTSRVPRASLWTCSPVEKPSSIPSWTAQFPTLAHNWVPNQMFSLSSISPFSNISKTQWTIHSQFLSQVLSVIWVLLSV